MNWDTELFCRKWLDGTLTRKKQHGSYYVQVFENSEWLCYQSSGMPAPIAMRCPETGILLMDAHNFRHALPENLGNGFRSRCQHQTVYVVDFGGVDRKAGDLAEIRAVDSTVVTRQNDKEATIVLFDVNGTKYYTDTKDGSTCKNREEYVNMHDIESHDRPLEMTLIRLPRGCSKVGDARLQSIPSIIGEGEFKVFNESFFMPAPDFSDIIDPKVLQTARWRPNGYGWGLPIDILRENGQLSWEWDRALGTDAFMKKVHKDITNAEEIKNCERYNDVYTKWSKAHAYITKRLATERPLYGCTFEPQAENALMGGDILYVKGVVREEDPVSGQKKLTLNLGKTWHAVIRKGETT